MEPTLPGPLRVLIVEDRSSDAELMVVELRRHGFEPSWHRVDTESELLAALGRPYDVLLTDFKLPQLDGLKVLEHVRARGLETPVLVVTGTVGEETAVECIKRGAFDYLLKDRMARLGSAVENALEGARHRRERRATDAALVRSQRELTAIFESTPVPTVIVNATGRVVRANRRALQHAGVDEAGACGLSICRVARCPHALEQHDLCGSGPQCDHCPLRSALLAAMQDLQPRVDVEVVAPDGNRASAEPPTLLASIQPIESESTLLAIVSLHDITQRRAAERALAQSEERYRRYFEEDLTAVHLTLPDGTLLDCNPAFASLFGFGGVAEALGSNTVDLYPDARARERLLSSLKEKRRVCNQELELRRRDGQPVRVIASSVGRFDESGRLTAIQGYLLDVTEMRRLEAHLLRAQRMEAIGRLAGGVAHDFNNLLQATVGAVDALRAQDNNPTARDQLLTELEENVRRGAQLTRQLLLFSRREAARVATLDVNQVVDGLAQMLRRLLRANVTLAVEVRPQPLPVRGDRGQLEQALMNLVVNAAEAMPGGGRVTIRTRREEEQVCLEVTDTGCGISALLLPSIFDPFFTTKELGTGLGLAVVHGVVTSIGGTVDVASRPGEGTTFVVRLPLSASGPHPPVAVTEARAGTAAGGGERVLVVEDDPAVRLGLSKVLSGLGYSVTSSADGQTALSLPPAPGFELLLVDQVLPDTTGVELLATLATRWPHAARILMSGYSEEAGAHDAAAPGALRFLAKPFSASELGREVQAALAARDRCEA